MLPIGTFAHITSSAAPGQTAQVIIYGTTPAGIMAAIEAKRNGASVILVGGWRDYNVGGMPAGGLGHTDINVTATCTGLARTFITTLGGQFDFRCSLATASFNTMLSNAGITPVFTTGVSSVSVTNGVISSFITVNGSQFNGSYFIDASYEGDLMALSGVTNEICRDANNANNTVDGFTTNQSLIFSGVSQHVDPYVTPGVSASGTISGVNPGNPPLTYPAIGTKNNNIQAYCFRMTLQYYGPGSTPGPFFVALPNTPPTGYDVSKYEVFLRFLDTMTTNGNIYGTTSGYDINYFFVKASLDAANCFDFNNGPAGTSLFAIDMPPPGPFDSGVGYMLGGAAEYMHATYTRREQIWEDHQSWILGLMYLVQQAADPRVPAPLTADWLKIGYDSREFTNPKPGDPTHFPYQLYVRVGRRMISDYIGQASDITQPNGNTPRSIKTIAQGSYKIDSHNGQYYISGGFVKMEGFINLTTGGVNNYFPIPYDVIIPARADCTNLFGLFCMSATSEAFNAMRMEVPMMEMGQAAGCAAAQAIAAGGGIAVQDINYTTLRTQLLAEGMVLPQVT